MIAPAHDESSGEPTIAVVALENIVKEYRTGDDTLTVLHGIELTVERGEFTAIVGASGSGKTTLMNIIGCLDRPTAGRYALEGEDVSGVEDDRLSEIRNRSIGFVFQSFNLISQLNVIENVEVPLFYNRTPKRERKDHCLEVIEAVGLSHRLKHYPTQLSGGECQRVAIARALVNRPRLLLTDEPTGNLDSKNGKEILELFHELHDDGATIITVTHNPEIAERLPRTIELLDGRVLFDGTGADWAQSHSKAVAHA